MNNPTGSKGLQFLDNNYPQIHPMYQKPSNSAIMHLGENYGGIHTRSGRIPCATTFRVINNKTKEERVLAGAKLMHFIFEVCHTFTVEAVLLRMSFFTV